MDPVTPGDGSQEHRYWREMIGAFVLGELDEEQRTALQAHLDGCEECRAEVRELEPVAAALAEVDPRLFETEEPRPPADLLERTLSRVEQARQTEDELQLRRRNRLIRRSAFAAVAAALLVVIGSFALIPKITGPPLEPVAFSETPPGVEAEANLIDHTWGTETILVVSGLEDGKTYRLTLRNEDGEAVPSGAFIGTGDQPVECRMNAALLREEATGLEVRTTEGDLVLEADLPEEAPDQSAILTPRVRTG
ncbi:MAG TPA: zf-HC2 domain-containing protein [Rubrobacter sp.]|nr:zf-HC2 domain-containing protein [Rubrobacter sp.]